VTLACVAAVLGAVGWRLTAGRAPAPAAAPDGPTVPRPVPAGAR
jgi:hypothetical protein